MPKSRWVFPLRIPISFGQEGRFVGKYMGLPITIDIFFNRSQAVLSVGKMGEGARDGCKRIC